MKLKHFYWFEKNRNDALKYASGLSKALYALNMAGWVIWEDYDFTPTFYEILTRRKHDFAIRWFSSYNGKFRFDVAQYDGYHYRLNLKIVTISWMI